MIFSSRVESAGSTMLSMAPNLNKIVVAGVGGLALAGSLMMLGGPLLSAPAATASLERQSAPGLTASAFLPSLTTSLQTTLQSPTAGRLLASNCFQCHGTDGQFAGGIDGLAGMSAAVIVNEMQSMRTEPLGNNIMKAHARGYTDAELLLIADYFSRQ